MESNCKFRLDAGRILKFTQEIRKILVNMDFKHILQLAQKNVKDTGEKAHCYASKFSKPKQTQKIQKSQGSTRKLVDVKTTTSQKVESMDYDDYGFTSQASDSFYQQYLEKFPNDETPDNTKDAKRLAEKEKDELNDVSKLFKVLKKKKIQCLERIKCDMEPKKKRAYKKRTSPKEPKMKTKSVLPPKKDEDETDEDMPVLFPSLDTGKSQNKKRASFKKPSKALTKKKPKPKKNVLSSALFFAYGDEDTESDREMYDFFKNDGDDGDEQGVDYSRAIQNIQNRCKNRYKDWKGGEKSTEKKTSPNR